MKDAWTDRNGEICGRAITEKICHKRMKDSDCYQADVMR